MKPKEKRANYICQKLLEPYIENDTKVIDIGSGDCVLTKTIKDLKSLYIIAVDKGNYSENEIVPVIYNGGKLPFDDDSFDCALNIFVLHYVKDREELLREMIRVSKKRIIILSDIFTNSVESFWARIWGYLANTSRSHDATAGFCISEKEFDKLISDLGLKIQTQKTFRMKPSWFLSKHKLVVLEK
jgi:ubiquinone/menaquinone biosynthesis C-methylase UbiE